MSPDASTGERAANHTWSIMSAIGGGAVVLVMSHAWSCPDGVRIEFDPLQSLLLATQCTAIFPGIAENDAAPYVISAIAAAAIGLAVEFVMWIRRRPAS